MEDALYQEHTTLGGHLSPRCTHALEQIDSVLKTVEKLNRLKVDKAMSSVIKKSDEFLACQRKTKKATSKRLPVKDKIRTTRTQ